MRQPHFTLGYLPSLLTSLLLVSTSWMHGAAGAEIVAHNQSNTMDLDHMVAKAEDQLTESAALITPKSDGVQLTVPMQALRGDVTQEGLWLVSTAVEDRLKPHRFRVRAMALRAEAQESKPASREFSSFGTVSYSKSVVQFTRPGLIEEFSVSANGVRQDFVIPTRPFSGGKLQMDLELTGVHAETTAYGAKLIVAATGRELAYSRLKVTDATGRELPASMEVVSKDQLQITVNDATAAYPVRIDPTFSDADWISLSKLQGANSYVKAVVSDNAGNLYVGGAFTAIGNTVANHVAKWNGSTWSALGLGVNGTVHALAIIGSDLYVGGDLSMAGGISANRVAKWNGSAWSGLGTGLTGVSNSVVLALTGIGSDLYVGGEFDTAGSVSARNIAKWDGSGWSVLGTGVNGQVGALASIGSDLFVGGYFSTAGGTSASCIAKWNGVTWSALGTGIGSGSVQALAVSGSSLYVGGRFSQAGGITVNNIARWTVGAPGSWSSLGSGMSGGDATSVLTLAVSGSTLYAGGDFATVGGVSAENISKWDGSSWSAVGSGTDGYVYGIVASSGTIFTVGGFTHAGTASTSSVASWDGSSWSAMGTGTDGSVYALATNGGALYAGGSFTMIGGVAANRIAKWNGSSWAPLGLGITGNYATVRSIVIAGSNLYVGGYFTTAGAAAAQNIARWDGSIWTNLGAGTNNTVNCLAVLGSDIVAGGNFTTAGGISYPYVAKWDGASWAGLGTGMNFNVYALAVRGTELFAGGSFSTANGISANRIAKWNGTAWSSLGTGMDGDVAAIAVNASALYAAGNFYNAGGVSANQIAKWDGLNWSRLGPGRSGDLNALALVGNDLYVGGNLINGIERERVLKWDGSSWTKLGSGVDRDVEALAAYGGDLYLGGNFTIAGGKVSAYVAQAVLAVVGPEIAVEQPVGTGLTDGASTVDFGSVVQGGSATLTFTVRNIGTTALTGLSLSKDGGHETDFTVGSLGVTSLAAGAARTFTVKFTPGDVGARSAVLHLTSNDANESPFDITVLGTGTPSPGILAINGTTFTVKEDASSVNIPVVRTNGSLGTVGVNVTATSGTAILNSDFSAPSSPLTLGDGINSGDIVVPILLSSGAESVETFTITIASPTGGAVLGSTKTATVRILDSSDTTAPSLPVVSSPGTGALVDVATGNAYTVTGTASDNQGISTVKVKLNGSSFIDASLASPGATSTTFSLPITPLAGLNTLVIQSFDHRNNPSSLLTRTFTVKRPLTVVVNDLLGNVTPGYTPSSFREIGKRYTITATAKTTPAPGYVFDRWTIGGGLTPGGIGVTPAALELPTLNFIMQEGLTLSAQFIVNPFAAVAGTYNGLIHPSPALPTPGATVSSASTEGFFTATVQPTGAFTAKLTLDGLTMETSGAFDNTGDARFGPSRATAFTLSRTGKPGVALDLFLDLSAPPGGSGKLTGTASQYYRSITTAVSLVNADRAAFNSANLVPPDYLGSANATATYTAIINPQSDVNQPSGLTIADYPQGTSFATLTVSKTGLVTFTGTLADGTTPVTLSSTLSRNLETSLFAQLYAKQGFFSTLVKLDSLNTESDMSSLGDALWAKPYLDVQHYPYGWPEVIKLSLEGAKYLVTSSESVVRTPDDSVNPPDADDRGDVLPGSLPGGNVELAFSGSFMPSVVRSLNLSTGDVVTELPAPDSTYSLIIFRNTGRISGTFKRIDDGTVPAFQGVIYQKGTAPGAYGYFMTITPKIKTYDGQSGSVKLQSK